MLISSLPDQLMFSSLNIDFLKKSKVAAIAIKSFFFFFSFLETCHLLALSESYPLQFKVPKHFMLEAF